MPSSGCSNYDQNKTLDFNIVDCRTFPVFKCQITILKTMTMIIPKP